MVQPHTRTGRINGFTHLPDTCYTSATCPVATTTCRTHTPTPTVLPPRTTCNHWDHPATVLLLTGTHLSHGWFIPTFHMPTTPTTPRITHYRYTLAPRAHTLHFTLPHHCGFFRTYAHTGPYQPSADRCCLACCVCLRAPHLCCHLTALLPAAHHCPPACHTHYLHCRGCHMPYVYRTALPPLPTPTLALRCHRTHTQHAPLLPCTARYARQRVRCTPRHATAPPTFIPHLLSTTGYGFHLLVVAFCRPCSTACLTCLPLYAHLPYLYCARYRHTALHHAPTTTLPQHLPTSRLRGFSLHRDTFPPHTHLPAAPPYLWYGYVLSRLFHRLHYLWLYYATPAPSLPFTASLPALLPRAHNVFWIPAGLRLPHSAYHNAYHWVLPLQALPRVTRYTAATTRRCLLPTAPAFHHPTHCHTTTATAPRSSHASLPACLLPVPST